MASTGTVLTASKQLKKEQGKLRGIFCSAASSTPTITIYDSATASTSDPTMISVFTPVAATSYRIDTDGILFKNGLYVVISGTVSATFIYE